MLTLTLLLPAAICALMAIGAAFDTQAEMQMRRDGVLESRRYVAQAAARAIICAAGFVAAFAPVLTYAIGAAR